MITPKLSRRNEILLDFVLVFLLTAALIRPFFKAKYTDKWASIESTFVADARFLMDHWPHPQWQPLWYGGTRFDYIYPPGLRYGTALIAKTFGYLPVKAYHAYTALFYAVGIAGVYLFIRVGTRSRRAAWLGAAAAALLSPSFLFLKEMRQDSWMWMPLRLGVLVKYGEGPHMTALALIPLALAFTWLALEAHRPAALAAAALFSAAVASNNFYGATALAVFYPILVWSFWITRPADEPQRILAPALAIPVLAYGLTAFWLVPSYFKVTAENMKYVSEHGTTWSIWIGAIVAIAFAVATDRWARGKPERTWAVFTAGSAVFFSLNVLGNNFFNFRIAGEPLRLVPELDLVYILGAVTIFLWLWDLPGRWPRRVTVIVLVAAFATSAGYVRHAWHMFPLWPDYQNRIEYKVSEWLWKNMPDSRAYPSGSVRFWFDAWHDLPQLGGGSEQGVLNGLVINAQWELNLGPKAEPSILWMQSMGVDTTYVSDKRSQEVFKDFLYPEKLAGALPAIYDDHQGNIIYRVPRRYAARVRVVETARLQALKPPQGNTDVNNLRAYVDVIEKGPDAAATLTSQGTDAMVVQAKIEPGQSILVQESYDPAWQAWSDGKPLAIRKDPVGFMALEVPPGQQEIHLMFVTPFENYMGQAVTAVSLLAILALFAMGFRARQRA